MRESEMPLLNPPEAKPNNNVNAMGMMRKNRKVLRSRMSWDRSLRAISKARIIAIAYT
jgi:hypothetical protein